MSVGSQATAQRVLVTGGASGFGLAIARRLAGKGTAVAIGDISPENLTRAVRAETGLLPIRMDVADPESVIQAIDKVVDALGGLEAIVLSAGIFQIGRLADVELREWERVLSVNLTGAFLCSQAAAPHLSRSGRGRIVAIASDGGRRGYPWLHAYSASKFGLIGLVECLAAELARSGVTVNAVAPAFCPTTGIGAEIVAWNGGDMKHVREQVGESYPVGRVVDEEDVAAAVEFLLADESSFLTGVILDVDGGRRLNFGPTQPDGSAWPPPVSEVSKLDG